MIFISITSNIGAYRFLSKGSVNFWSSSRLIYLEPIPETLIFKIANSEVPILLSKCK